MTRRLLLTAILLLALFPAQSLAGEPRIFSGVEASKEHFGSAVALVYKRSAFADQGHFCGGVLIKPRWVLTAAHCSLGNIWRNTDVVVGRKDLSVAGGQRIAVSASITHPKYSFIQSAYDFALLRLAKKAKAQPVDELYRGKIQGGKTLFVGGWGETEYQTMPSQMQEVRVRSYSKEYCASRYGVRAAVFCAGRIGGKYDACFGDSGGPIVSRKGTRETLWGLVSFGRGCGLAKWPGAYAEVSAALPWIKKTTSSPTRQIFRAPGKDLFPSESDTHLGPLQHFTIDKWERDEYPETPNLLLFRITERWNWPAEKVLISLAASGKACGQYACNQGAWRMEEYKTGGWFLYLYTEKACPSITATAHLRKDKRFIIKKSIC